MQIVFCPRTGWDGRSATGMTSSLRMTSGDDCRGRQYSRAAAQLMSTSAALPEIRDEQAFSIFPRNRIRVSDCQPGLSGDWPKRKRWYAILHRFDPDGNPLGPEALFADTTAGGE